MFTLVVTDDGVGLTDTNSVGVGLRSMRERAAELGGTCDVTRTPDGETRISVFLPIAKEETHETDSSPDR